MSRTMRGVLGVGLFIVGLAGGLQAQERPFLDEVDPMQATRERAEEFEWQESRAGLPEFPRPEDLLEFDVDKAEDPFRYFIDTASIELGEDQVLRYTLVIRSERGGENIFYEGMRCETLEYKVYAYGSPSRKVFQRAPDSGWQDVRAERHQRHHRDLFDFYLCLHGMPRTKDQVLDAITRPGSNVIEEFFAE